MRGKGLVGPQLSKFPNLSSQVASSNGNYLSNKSGSGPDPDPDPTPIYGPELISDTHFSDWGNGGSWTWDEPEWFVIPGEALYSSGGGKNSVIATTESLAALGKKYLLTVHCSLLDSGVYMVFAGNSAGAPITTVGTHTAILTVTGSEPRVRFGIEGREPGYAEFVSLSAKEILS